MRSPPASPAGGRGERRAIGPGPGEGVSPRRGFCSALYSLTRRAAAAARSASPASWRGVALALLLAAPAAAQTVAITGGMVSTGSGAAASGTVVIAGGRIAAAGPGAAVPAGARVIDATGKWVTPGIVAGMSWIGLDEVTAVEPSADSGARTSPFSAALDIAASINPNATPIAVERSGGITRAVVGTSATREIFGGQGALIALTGQPGMVTRARAFQLVELGEDGARIAGGSRAATFLNLRNGLDEARRYARNPAAYTEGRDRDALLTRLDVAALVPVVDGRVPLVVSVHRASDIRAVLALRGEFAGLKLILLGAREGWLVASEIAAAGVPVITQPMLDLPNSFETLASSRSNVGRLVAAGVKVGLGVLERDASFQPRNLAHYAGNMVAQARLSGGVGLTHEQAIAALTRHPAEIFGMADTGTLAAGKRADVVVWDGDPLELASVPVALFIDGIEQPLTSRQTELRDRYRDLRRGDLPIQYPR